MSTPPNTGRTGAVYYRIQNTAADERLNKSFYN